jgi:hypothetical protein
MTISFRSVGVMQSELFGGQFEATGELSAAATSRMPRTPLAALPAMSSAGKVTSCVHSNGASGPIGRSGGRWTKSHEQPGASTRRTASGAILRQRRRRLAASLGQGAVISLPIKASPACRGSPSRAKDLCPFGAHGRIGPAAARTPFSSATPGASRPRRAG